MRELKFTILHNSECHSWPAFYNALKQWIREWGIKNKVVEPEIILVESDEAAERWCFAGSPQLLVNGKDVDPAAERITNYHAAGCRIYEWEGKVYEYPPKQMVEKALLDIAKL